MSTYFPSSVDQPESARVLVVEDEAIVARDICLQLSSQGYEPVGDVSRGNDALALVEETRPDIVLMDISLKGEMDGIATARVIRERFSLPVVFLTALTGQETLERAREVDPFGYIIKPFDEQELRTVLDIALYKHRSESRLRESEARLRAITDSARDAIIMMDSRGAITFWNPAAEHIFGYTEAEMMGNNLHEMLAGEPHLSSHRMVFPEFLRTGRGGAIGRTLELTARCKDGREVDIALSLSAVSHQNEWHAVGIVRDITEQKQNESTMRLQSAAMKAAISSVIITDAQGNIEWVNAAFCRISGYTREEVMGKNPRMLKSGEQSPEYYRDMWLAITAGHNWTGEFVNRRKDGTLYTETVSITPVKDDTGHVSHFIAIKQDISAFKRSLAELESARSELEEKNRALDAALAEARMAVQATAASRAAIDELKQVAQSYPCRILVAGDSPEDDRVALEKLALLGYHADTVSGGPQAIEACRAKSYDLVLINVRMPGLDGLETTRRIRRIDGQQPVIVALESNSTEADREGCFAAGMDDCVAQPVRLDDLRRLVRLRHDAPPDAES